jgi:hypothetical protein
MIVDKPLLPRFSDPAKTVFCKRQIKVPMSQQYNVTPKKKAIKLQKDRGWRIELLTCVLQRRTYHLVHTAEPPTS